MSESQNMNINELFRGLDKKLDSVVKTVNDFKIEITNDITELRTRLEMQPEYDRRKDDGVLKAQASCRQLSDEKFAHLEERIKKQEDNTTWLVRTVIGQIIILFFGILVIVYTFMK